MSENRSIEHVHQGYSYEKDVAFDVKRFIENSIAFSKEMPGFTTKEGAEKARAIYTEQLISHAAEIKDISEIDLTVSGEGVLIPALSVNDAHLDDDGGSSGVYMYTRNDAPMCSLDLGEEISVRFRGVNVQVVEDDFGYKLKSSMIVALNTTLQKSMQVDPEIPVPFVHISIDRLGLVALDGSAGISVDLLEAEHLEQEAKERARQYTKTSFTGGAFGKYLNRLETAFSKADRTVYTELKNPRLVRALGRAAAEIIPADHRTLNTMQDTLLYRLGKDRLLDVTHANVAINDEGKIVHSKINVKGRLLHVAVENADGAGDSPQFVLEGMAQVDGNIPYQGTHYVPFTEVEQLSF